MPQRTPPLTRLVSKVANWFIFITASEALFTGDFVQ
jgi:hypothetical protein